MSVAVFWGAIILVGAPALKDRPPKNDQLVGRWGLEKAFQDGNDITKANTTLEYCFSSDSRWTVRQFGKEADTPRRSYRVTAGPKCKQIDLCIDASKPDAKILPGIYEVNGDRLILCFERTTSVRPTNFESDRRGTVVLLYLYRLQTD